MASQSEQFFEHYQQALNAADPVVISDFHLLPSIFVNDDSKVVCSSNDSLLKVNQGIVDSLMNLAIDECQAQVMQAMRLSDKVTFCSVRWKLCGQKHPQPITCNCSYTSQTLPDGEYKIIVSVMDDEHGVFAVGADS